MGGSRRCCSGSTATRASSTSSATARLPSPGATRARGEAPEDGLEGEAERQADPRRTEPLVGRPRAGLEPRLAKARGRGALRQARAQSLPARDAVPALTAGQGTEGLHVARGQAPAPPTRP